MVLLIFLCSCASQQQKKENEIAKENIKQKLAEVTNDEEELITYSENPEIYNPSDRQYKRMTKARMEEEAGLHASAGSMWVMEGQGAYLFAQNKQRREGDVLNVKMEGQGLKQVDTKISVVKKLLKELDEQERLEKLEKIRQQQLAEAAKKEASGELSSDSKSATTPVDPKSPADAARAPAAAAKANAVAEKPVEKDEPIKIDNVATQIIEKLPDGKFRVRGAQPFMIGSREYKVIVTGLVRQEDFNDAESINSSKLIEPQYDVVSARRSKKSE